MSSTGHSGSKHGRSAASTNSNQDSQSADPQPAKRTKHDSTTTNTTSRTHGPRMTHSSAPTVKDLITDELAPLANQYWAPGSTTLEPYQPAIIDNIYIQHLAPVNQKTKEREEMEANAKSSNTPIDPNELAQLTAEEEKEQSQIEIQRAHRLLLLELSAYLENYLWKYFDAETSSFAHIMSILMLLNQKFKENLLSIWDCFSTRPDSVLLSLFDRILHLKQSHDLTVFEATQFLTFLIHAYQSFEQPIVRKVFMRLANVDSWRSLRDSTLRRIMIESQTEQKSNANESALAINLREVWKKIETKPTNDLNAIFLPNLLIEFITILYSIEPTSPIFNLTATSSTPRVPYHIRAHIIYLERFVEFLTDCLTQRGTRRWVKKLLEEIHLVVLCRQSTFVQKTQAQEKEVQQRQANMAAQAKRRRVGSDAMEMDVLQATTATEGGAILTNQLSSSSSSSFSSASGSLPGRLFVQLLNKLEYYQYFEVDDLTGQPLASQEILNRHYLDIQLLQKICFKFFPDVPKLVNMALANVSRLDEEESLRDMLTGLTNEQLRALCIKLQLLPRDEEVTEYQQEQTPPTTKKSKSNAITLPTHVPRMILPLLPYMTSTDFLTSLILSTFVLRRNTREEIASMPLYPNEQLLFDEHAIPSINYTGETCLALPKLNLQFLTIHDYLQRNFHLYQGESTYEIREDIAYTVKRLKPRVAADGGNTVFTGWARMASPIQAFAVTTVAKPLIGETKPSSVRAEITIDLALFNGTVREEWEALKTHDVLFLIHVQALVPIHVSTGNMMTARQTGEDPGRRKFDVEGQDLETGVAIPDESFRALATEPILIRTVRGCQVRSVLDQYKKVIGERDDKGNVYQAKGSIRTYRVELDAAQFAADKERTVTSNAPDAYSSFNLVLRRKPKENNFAGVLETIRDLMSDTSRGTAAIPRWLSNVFLGYGDPKESQYYRLENQLSKVEFVDTFIDLQHLKESFHENLQIADRTAEEIEAEKQGESQLNLVALGGEGNNRQTAAATSIELTRQVMRLVQAAQKAKKSDAPITTTDTTFRVTFPLHVEPNLEILQQLLYARDSTLAANPSTIDSNVRFVLNAGEENVKVSEATGQEEKASEDVEMKDSNETTAAATTETEPIAPVFETLHPPSPFKLKKPEFTLKEPTKPAAAESTSSITATPAAASTDIESEIAHLSSLTVPKIKELMEPFGLSVKGTKPVLIERLSEAMRANAKSASDSAAAASDSATTTASAAPSAESLAKYESELKEYQTASSAYQTQLKSYETELAQHEAAVAAHQQATAAQAEQRKSYESQLAAFKQRQSSTTKKNTAAVDTDGDATMVDVAETKSEKKGSGKKKKKGGKGNVPTTDAAVTPAPTTVAAPTAAVVIPPSTQTLQVELLPRVHARHGYQKRNLVRFTPIQVEAIKSGLNPGLTMIVGPPGTGKTDTAVQIISELYHNFPEQRTLLITHSNHALNDLFEKIMERDIDERYLLRLGRGSEEIASASDMSKFGRVNYMLQRRLNLLEEVAALAKSLQMTEDVAYTCETSGHFFLYHILARWEKFTAAVQAAQRAGAANLDSVVAQHFPFTAYFTQRSEKQAKIWQQYYQSQAAGNGMDIENTPAPPVHLFRSTNFAEDMSIAVSCFAELQTTFVELEETRPFELLRSYKDRSNYLLTKHAKIIAMTCTHAAIKRKDLVDLKFQFENIIMEESAQILDIETFIPMLLQRTDPETGQSRLKRIILLGDHHQLPPVIKNRAFQKYSHLDQSLFTRFIRLGLPYIQLNAQGRMRSSLAQLWNWNYNNLGNLPIVQQNPAYQYGNVGFAHEYQLINVEDLNGVGESSPTPFFYQNLAEAEYVVQTYMYMRLLGYPASRISIITTYNGQKHLIRDILAQRCASNLLFGLPHKVSTVDKFQGQQNDFILLSLVRTRTAGHLRDVRRLVVAMSRARLGMYIFGRVALFSNSYELTRTFNTLLQKPVRLHLLPQEKKPMDQPLATGRLVHAPVDPTQILEVRDVLHMGELVASMTLSVQSEYGEYHRRIAQAEAEERQKREAYEQARREYLAARDATERAEAQAQAQMEAETRQAKEAEQTAMEEDTEERQPRAVSSKRGSTKSGKGRSRSLAPEEFDSDQSSASESEPDQD